MRRVVLTTAGVLVLGVGPGAYAQALRPVASHATHGSNPAKAAINPAEAGSSRTRTTTARTTTTAPPALLSAESQNALINEYCLGCHDEDGRAGGLSLQDFKPGQADRQADIAERMIRKLRAGMMPPPTAPKRPDAATIQALAASLEAKVDAAASANPNPGWRPFQRLNRAEYARAVRDLVGLDVDVTAFLPPDTISHGYDNVADVQSFSAALMEGYLRAAGKIAALAVGDPDSPASESTYRVPPTASQLHRVDGAPFGTRGGLSVVHTFPADGDYVFRMELQANPCGLLYGATAENEQVEISIDGARAALVEINPRMTQAGTGLQMRTPPIHVKAGAQRVTAAFVKRFESPVLDLIAPIDHTLADTQIGVAYGITTLPHLKDLNIVGPRKVTGVSDTVSRRRIFSCRPTSADDERACAGQIVRTLATDAFRAPVSGEDFAGLMRFYDAGRKERDFESGITAALEAVLASPQFLFRVEAAPAGVRPGQPFRVSGRELASRLSFYLWNAPPDGELLNAASTGGLATRAGLEKQVRRMLADPRSEALSTRFASQWFRLNDVDQMLPDALLYPYYDHTLAESLKRETQLFFDSLVREDHDVTDLLTADYTFVNERIARHYGIANVTGNAFRRVPVPEYRRGLLGHGSILVLTSVADRTSPVMRGKWVMEVLLGSPPPPPPPNVPALDETKASSGARRLTVRERMEEHRKSPACASCHRVIDPIGLALESYDVTGKWRIKDNEMPIDSAGVMYDGTKVEGPAGLRQALLHHRDTFLRTFTDNLMTYALGRRVEYYDQPAIRAIVREAEAGGNRMSAYILGIVNSAAFQMSRAAGAETAAEASR